MKLTTFFGVPFNINWTWFLFILLVWSKEPEILLMLLSGFFFVTLHEYGHVLMAQWCKLKVVDVTLYPIGGVARIAFTYNDYKEELYVTIAGPLVNKVLAIVFFITSLFFENSYLASC